MKEHTRRPHYWRYYHLGHTTGITFLIEIIVGLIRENPCPRPAKSGRGHPPTHSIKKMDFICVLTVAFHKTYRDMESWLYVLKIPWNEPVPDHTTMAKHFQTIPADWLDSILAETARRCMAEADWIAGSIGADSSGVETTRYEQVTRPSIKKRDFVENPRKIYMKYHIVAALGLQTIMASETTPSNVNDSTMLPVMPDAMEQQDLDPGQSALNADRGYDSDKNCGKVLGMGMIPNIKQRKDAVNRGKPSRSMAARLFDQDEYRKRGMIEGAFGAEETKRHQLHCRFIREDNRLRFARIRAIAWNIKVLNRFECASRLRIPIPTYGGLARAACA